MPIPTIRTARLTMRGFRPDDLYPLHALVSDPETVRYFPRHDPWPIEVVERWIEQQRTHWRQHGFGWFALELRDTAAEVPAGAEVPALAASLAVGTSGVIGWCGLCALEETQEVEVLYLLGKPYWGRGLATEAARWSVAHAFSALHLEHVIGLTHPDNFASQHVLQKCGLVYSDRVEYWGMELLRHVIDRARFEQVYTE